MTRKIFGTDGVRGLANQFPMDPETALALGKAIAYFFKGSGSGRHRIVIGKDTRLSGYMFENALSAGICSMGGEAVFLGPMPTPGIAFITQAMRADAGVMISASHNPYYDNGIKFFDHQGYKLADEIELKMEDLVFNHRLQKGVTHQEVGKAYRVDDAVGRYIEYLKATFPKELTLEGLKIVVDSANGCAYKIAPIIFEELGANVISIGDEPNGFNINDACGALYPKNLQKKVQSEKADLGIALDGDADRLVLVDQHGEIINGDCLIALFAFELKKRNQLAKAQVAGTILSNLGLEIGLAKQDIQLLRCQVGDRYIIEAMREQGINFGGEPSGHIIFHDQGKTGDGLLAALQFLSIMIRDKKKASDLAQVIEIFPQVSVNIKVKEKKDLSSNQVIQNKYLKIANALNGKGRIILRYSGTEPLLRLMLEGQDQKILETYAAEIKEVIEEQLN